MILGGIPFYLSLLRSDLSLSGNIDNLFFRKRAELWDEFDHLYQTLFSNSHQYIRIVETLSKKRGGMTRSELAESSGVHDNHSLTEMLDDLSASDFVRICPFFGKKKQDTRYQLSDYYSLFYFRFLKDYYGGDEQYWSHSYDHPSHRVWAGLTFEMLCRDHVRRIKQKLGIGGVLSEESTWYEKNAPDGSKSKGAQIDMLIDRRDHVINLCEIKFSTKEFEIDKKYQETLRNKMEVFRTSTGTKKSLQLTMITTYGVMRNKYSNMVASQVVLDDLFE